ncbi:permease, partial [Arthrobacter stackebrandtii]
MLAQLSFSGLDWLPILLGVGVAYVVFGIAG